jgi:glycerate 2-kinase
LEDRQEEDDLMRVLVVPDKFKGTLTAPQAAAAIARGWSDIRPYDRIEQLPMADGGDGFGEIMGHLLDARRQTCSTVDCAGRPRLAQWWLAPDGITAIVETAQVNGLALFEPGQFHAFQLDTFGIGAVFRQAEATGVRRLYVGIGGSATNDGGFGLARSLGWTFWNTDGTELLAWTQLNTLARVETPQRTLAFDELIIAGDVMNPLLGSRGATRVYGPQKGLLGADLAHAEACMARLVAVTEPLTGRESSRHDGAGAAGGLGFGLEVFCGGTLQSGGEIFATLSRLEQRIQHADLVITAEGAMDAQTLMGKGVGMVAEAAARNGKRCLCLAGTVSVDPATVLWPGFVSRAIVPGMATLDESQKNAECCLQRLAAQVASELC